MPTERDSMTFEQENPGAGGLEAGGSEPEADVIRRTERQRLQALVQGNMEVAQELHADAFELINPGGRSRSKEQYLGGILSGQLNTCFGNRMRFRCAYTVTQPSFGTNRRSRSSSRETWTLDASGIRTYMRSSMGAGRQCGRRRPGYRSQLARRPHALFSAPGSGTAAV
jgi:Domain of unknown function (DUF4440)